MTFLWGILGALVIGGGPTPVVRSVDLHRGPVRAQFGFQVRAAAFRAVRLRVPHGSVVRVSARDRRRLAGVGTSTTPFVGTCRRDGRFDVCETSVEGCPAPQGRWDTVVTKLSMPPARVLITFVFSASSG